MPTTTITHNDTRQLQSIADSISRSRKTVVVTGAGISTNAGIPDFRSANGLYNLVKSEYPDAVVKGRDLFDRVLFSDPTSTALFYTFLARLRDEVLKVHDTTPTHKFIRTLSETGRLLRCYTQNIDGLEEREGLITDLSCGRGKRKRPSPTNITDDNRTQQEKGCQVVQLHGELRSLRCTQCQLLTSYTPSSVRTLLSGTPPACPACETASITRQAAGKRATKIGTLRPNIVLYGEEHPEAEIVGTLSESDIKAAPDMMIILGTSLKVHGLKRIVKEFAKAVHAKGGIVIFVNNTAPSVGEWKDIIDFHVDMDCDRWATDVKKRRPGIWERQTKLPVQRVVKAALGVSNGNKQKLVAAEKVLIPAAPAKKTSTTVATPKGRKPAMKTPLSPPSTTKGRKKSDPQEQEISESPLHKRRRIMAATPPPTPSRSRLVAVEIMSPKKQRPAPPVEILGSNKKRPAPPVAIFEDTTEPAVKRRRSTRVAAAVA